MELRSKCPYHFDSHFCFLNHSTLPVAESEQVAVLCAARGLGVKRGGVRNPGAGWGRLCVTPIFPSRTPLGTRACCRWTRGCAGFHLPTLNGLEIPGIFKLQRGEVWGPPEGECCGNSLSSWWAVPEGGLCPYFVVFFFFSTCRIEDLSWGGQGSLFYFLEKEKKELPACPLPPCKPRLLEALSDLEKTHSGS